MSSLRFITAGLVHHWRMHVAVALGVAAATAVLTGALLVGDSVRGSLRHLTLDRLGRIDEVLLVGQFFRAELAGEVAGDKRFAESFREAVPLIMMRGTVEKPAADGPAWAGDVSVVGCDASFWQLHPDGSAPPLAAGEIVLNEPLAADLGAAIGDEVVLRIPLPGDIPSDSPLGEKIDTAASRRLEVSAVIPASGLGRFGLRASQQLPRNAYVATQILQTILDQPDKVNAILVAGNSPDRPSTPQASTALAAALRPQAIDYGLSIQQIRLGDEQNPASQYIDISSNRMLLPKPVVAAAEAAFADEGLQPALTYLANTIAAGEQKIPYSTITGIDPTQPLGPYSLDDGRPLADDEIVLNRWAADDLGVEPGDEIAVSYYLPESTHGRLDEPPPKTFRLRAIVPLSAKDEPPTRANDPHLTPELAGVTDQESIDDWDLPFALDEAKHGKIRPKDEQYWDDHRTTPKAFVTLATARRLWSSRFGDTTSLRIPITKNLTPAAVFDRLDLEPAAHGFEFRPVKRLALEASAGTTPFDMLFLGFSFFIIAAAVMLTALLFRLGVERRAEEIGTLTAVGLRRRQIAGLLAGEGLLVASAGALVGVAAGAGYAWLMLAGLRTWWLAAISTPFLRLHVSFTSLAIGYLAGVGVSLLAIVWSLRRLGGVSVRRLLAGQASEEVLLDDGDSRRGGWIAVGLFLVAVVLGLLAMRLGGEAQAGAFFGSGALVLAAVLTLLRTSLRCGGRVRADGGRFALGELATRNAARNPGRSTLTMGLVATASFLIVALSAFRLDPTEQGTGGFALLAESDQPIVHDINTPSGRDELAFSAADSDRLGACRTWSLRARAGDDASCLNLYKPRQPRILGVPHDLVSRGGFGWADSAATTAEEKANPWLLLEKPRESGAVPVVLDASTAIYSLHLGSFAQSPIGQIYTIDDDRGGTIRFEVVGLLNSSILQGNLLISEANFLRQFPDTAGYRFFLVDVPPDDSASQIRQVLEAVLSDRGFDAQLATRRLDELLAVQNTYLSTFQSLGALGLLLGTLGLATVQLRNVLERRGELALLRATGFRHRRLAALVMLENVVLLLGGLAAGLVAALVAVLPHALLGGAVVPWRQLALLLGLVLVVGLAVSLVAVRATLRAPLLAALRGE